MRSHDPRFEALFNTLNQNPSKPPGLLQKVGAILAAAIVFGLALTVSVLLFAVVAAAAIVIWGYLWWKTRALRAAMREAQACARTSGPRGPADGGGIVIEGEVVREVREERREDSRG